MTTAITEVARRNAGATGDVAFYCGAVASETTGRGGVAVILVDAAGETLAYTTRSLEKATPDWVQFAAVDGALAFATEHDVRSPAIRTSSASFVESIAAKVPSDDGRVQRVLDLARRRRATIRLVSADENCVALAIARRAMLHSVFPLTLADVEVEVRRALADETLDDDLRRAQHFVMKYLTSGTEAVVESLRAMKVGRTKYSTMKEADARSAAVCRHDEVSVRNMESVLGVRSSATRLKALRWAARGLAPSLVAAKLEIERAATIPYRLRTGGRYGTR